jgi:hypothetical protein
MKKFQDRLQISQQAPEDDYLYSENVVIHRKQGFTGMPTDKNCHIYISMIKNNGMTKLKKAYSCYHSQYFQFTVHSSLPMYTVKYELLIALITKPQTNKLAKTPNDPYVKLTCVLQTKHIQTWLTPFYLKLTSKPFH